MKTDAVVYTSNTGYTRRYAEMLGEKTGLPVYALSAAKAELARGSRVIYLGCLRRRHGRGGLAASGDSENKQPAGGHTRVFPAGRV